MDSQALQSSLLNWYARNGRDLPWRGEADPYKIWISEVMLQQTQVTTVIPYYHRFLERFPTVDALATASVDDVLKAWEGLGYYARARNLHKAARDVVEKHNGELPETFKALKTLPGFGDYTAGAVASIAFGEAVAAVDGNVKRVISRLYAIEEDISTAAALSKIKAAAEELAQTAPIPADWTQAVMELGATVCLPAKPRCLLCPAGQGLCRGRSLGIAESLPVKRKKKPVPHYDVTAAVIYADAERTRFLIAQRPHEGMLGGLWEFPGGKVEPGETLPECLKREIIEELGIEIDVAEPVTAVKHAFTHFKITLHAFAASIISGAPQKIDVADWAWVSLADVDRYAFGRTDQKVIQKLRELSLQNKSRD